MTAHDCRTFDPHCFRCDLSRQEASLARDPDDLTLSELADLAFGPMNPKERTMTTLYRPVPIESTEQAEALPEGAVLLGGHLDEPWDLTTFYRDPDEGCPAVMLAALAAGVRVMALVPVEAEEETRTDRPGRRGIHPVRRLVTPWEEA